jgi:hypothetical protein
MDKAEFVELAPQYYALAIALAFASKGGELTRQSIMNEYIVHEEDGDTYFLLDDFTIWNQAIAWLVDRDMILAFTDPFGPPVYNKGDISTANLTICVQAIVPLQMRDAAAIR